MSLLVRNRIISIFIFLIWPFGILLFSYCQISKRRDFMFYAILFSLCMGLYGYVFNGRHDLHIDIVHIYNHYEMMRNMDFIEAVPFFVLRGDLSLLTLWLLSLTGANAQIVGFFVSFMLSFSIVFVFDKWMLLVNIRNRNNLFLIGVAMYLFTIHPMSISGVRTPIAFSLYILGFISYFCNNKKSSFLFFALSIANHFSMLFIVILFIISISFERNKIRNISLILAFSFFLFKPLMFFLMNFLSSCGVVGLLLASKVNYYVFEELSEGEVRITTGSNIWLMQYIAIEMILLFIELLPPVRKYIKNNNILYHLEIWIWLLASFVIFNITNITMFARFTTVLIFFSSLFLMSIVGLAKSNKLNIVFQSLFVLIVCIAGVALLKEKAAIPEYQVAYQNVPELLYNNLFQLLKIDVNYINVEYQNFIEIE